MPDRNKCGQSRWAKTKKIKAEFAATLRKLVRGNFKITGGKEMLAVEPLRLIDPCHFNQRTHWTLTCGSGLPLRTDHI